MADALSCQTCLLSEMRTEVQGFEGFSVLYCVDPYFAPIYTRALSNADPKFHLHEGFLFKGVALCIPTCSLRTKLIQDLHSLGM